MPLQIRRGTTAERTSIRPVIGELIYDTQLKQVYVGDSTDGGVTGTLGGNTVSTFGIEDAQDAIRDLFNALNATQNYVVQNPHIFHCVARLHLYLVSSLHPAYQ